MFNSLFLGLPKNGNFHGYFKSFINILKKY